jgi:hypothetical protein
MLLGAFQPAQHEVEPELELRGHVNAAAEVVGDGEKVLVGRRPVPGHVPLARTRAR